MTEATKNELLFLNNIESMIGVFEPLYNSKKEITEFHIKFLNDCFIKELTNGKTVDENINELNKQIKDLFKNCICKFNKGIESIINEIRLYDKSYRMQCSKYKDKFLICTFYDNQDIYLNQKQSSNCINVLENFVDIILIVSEDGKILYGNKKAVDTYGYTYDELIKLNIFNLRNQDIKEYTKLQLKEAIKRGIIFKTFHYKKDGSKFPVEVRSVYTSENSKDRVISIIRDISDIDKIINEATMFSASLDIFDDTIIGLTKDFKISLWNLGAERKLGYKKEEVVGKSIKMLVPDDKISELNEKVRMLKNGNIIENLETKRIHKSGIPIDVSISMSPLYDVDGIFSGTIGIYKDISEKKELAKKLQEYEERWRLALEGGRFGVWDLDIANRRLFHYNNWEETLGYEKNELNGSFDNWQGLVHPDDLHKVTNKYYKHFKGEEYVVEYRIRCKSNTYKWIRTKGKISEWSDDGKPLRMIGTNEDITNEKLIQEELKEKYKQLESIKQEAENANKAKSQFLANMSHEIRTPMNGIIAAVQLLQSINIIDEQKKYLKIIKDSSETLIEIINDILDISKLESGKVELNDEPFNLKEIISCIYEYLLVAGNSKGLEIGYYLDPNIDFEVIGDELKLKQILRNLISNAIKFTDNGYVSFRVKMISSDENSERIEFIVKDTGIGIDEDYKQKIFQNFSQGDLSTNKKYMGSGLGLAISKQLAKLMNGDIYFESTAGKGSTFHFVCIFKKMRNTIDSIKVNDVSEQKRQNDKLEKDKVILCVEDNLINQDILESIIIKKGYKYIAAYDGKEALEKFKNNKIDIIIMDIQIPEINGFEITKIIRNEQDCKSSIPIIAMTAYAMYEDREKCIQAGMNDYISKPFDIEKFYSILEFYLGE